MSTTLSLESIAAKKLGLAPPPLFSPFIFGLKGANPDRVKREKPLFVTEAYLPPLEEYLVYLNKIWATRVLTNQGPLALELEQKLTSYCETKHLLWCSNGTIAIQMAIQALELSGEIITTPFTYVATANAVVWEKCTPVFVDIDPNTLCIDPEQIERAITPKTSAILGVHVYGNPCEVDRIDQIAKKHNLKTIYDGAHAIGSTLGGKSLLSYGDISTLSFHATKLFHTVEGGAVMTSDASLARKMSLFRGFGHVGDDYFSVGINAKNSEFHAAMGLCNITRMDEQIQRRKQAWGWYDELLMGLRLRVVRDPRTDFKSNYSYYPVVFESEQETMKIKNTLLEENIHARRYFYPSLNTLPFLPNSSCPNSEDIASRILCLPLAYSLKPEDAEQVAKTIRNVLR